MAVGMTWSFSILGEEILFLPRKTLPVFRQPPNDLYDLISRGWISYRSACALSIKHRIEVSREFCDQCEEFHHFLQVRGVADQRDSKQANRDREIDRLIDWLIDW